MTLSCWCDTDRAASGERSPSSRCRVSRTGLCPLHSGLSARARGTMADTFDFPLHGTSLNIVRRYGPHLSEILQSKFGCVATIDGVDFKNDPHRMQNDKEKRFVAALPGGVQVSVWKADLAKFQADAVVNAANEQLQHYGGLALALSMAGGLTIQSESSDYISKHGAVTTGEAIVLNAGALPCKKIIHAVGPFMSSNAPDSELVKARHRLEQVVRSILERVKENRLQSVAIPAISSGLFNYPLADCANTIVTSVLRYYEHTRSPAHLPKEIFFVNIDQRTVDAMERACRRILGNSPSGGKASATSAPVVQLGDVLVMLKRGHIQEQQTDVIVNSTSRNRDLNVGLISSALLMKAGSRLQDELWSAPYSEFVIPTKGYKLQCKQVFHVICPGKENYSAKQILYKLVLQCLRMAAAQKYKSISFPAIGTGNLGFDRRDSACIMHSAVAEFSQSFKGKMEVYFVIFPSDDDIFKAFEELMPPPKQKASYPGSTRGNNTADSSPPAAERGDGFRGDNERSPRISLYSPRYEARSEARRWLSGLLCTSSGPVVIRNNFIQHFGESKHQQLSRLTGVTVNEFIEKGRAHLNVSGQSVEDVAVAVLEVEAMLCDVQREFVMEEKSFMHDVTTERLFSNRKLVDKASPEFKKRSASYRDHNLLLVKMERVENPTLETLFDLKRAQLHCTTPPQQMFQRIPAHFCEMVSQVGFHAEFAPPKEPAYGAGIYFARTAKKALEVWKWPKEENEEYVYFVEAEVLTGNSTRGEEGLILPPAVGADPNVRFDSVSGPDVAVIFSGYQARPKYIITCSV
uniref:protein mono-ADP-ribosyltransferase PARP9 isoform X1 n=1 Tax=Gasterosteus aculeatus aculeatus TaxID=481459 RepID=UPI001A9915D4|nr:protein mono-ADP-ribosyltransferase PARP9 isoform X1 [Gasterosteus aculeatus aculeatus]